MPALKDEIYTIEYIYSLPEGQRAELIDGVIYNYTNAFVILEDYDVQGQYMDTGDYRVVCDGDYVSNLTTWPLSDTRTVKKATGISHLAK